MSIDIARAWKDAQYKESLTSEERAQLPQSPIGSVELTDNALATVNGALCPVDPCRILQGFTGEFGFDGGFGFGGRRSGGPWYRGNCGYGGNGGYGGGSWYGGNEYSGNDCCGY